MHSFIPSVLVFAEPDLNSIRRIAREGHTEVRRGVEGTASSRAANTVPKGTIIVAIAEVVIPNKGRRQGSLSTIVVITGTSSTTEN